MRKPSLILAAVLLTACSEAPTEPAAGPPGPTTDHVENGASGYTYEVTFYNLTRGQPFTPPVLATHARGLEIFRRGAPASEGIQEVAENGNPVPLLTSLEADGRVSHIATGAAPVMPGASMTLTIEAGAGATRLSWASMLICTNDGFTGLRGVHLPSRVGQVKTHTLDAHDAGTEINTEDFSDMVPPCAALTGIETDEMGTGATDPALAENGKIRHHRGISGADDLVPPLHGWRGPVARVTVERIG